MTLWAPEDWQETGIQCCRKESLQPKTNIFNTTGKAKEKKNWLGLKPMHKKKFCEENRRFLANWGVELCWTETMVHEQETLSGNEALELRHNISVSQVSHSTVTSS